MQTAIEGLHKHSQQLATIFVFGSDFPIATASRLIQGQAFLSIAHIHLCVHVAADLD